MFAIIEFFVIFAFESYIIGREGLQFFAIPSNYDKRKKSVINEGCQLTPPEA